MNKFSDILTKQLKVKVPVWVLILIPLIAYLVWEYYWYSQVGLRVIKWHTHLMLFAYVWVLVSVLLYLIFARSFPEIFKKIMLGFTSVLFVLFLFEVFLLISGYNKTYLELAGGYYFSPYEPENESHYHTWPTNSNEHWIEKPEYRHWRPTNTLGYPDEEWKLAKEKGEMRILALGDSFTEGDGAPFDSSYVAILRNAYFTSDDSISIMNAGVCGSDPFFDFEALKDKLIVYHPDVILQTLSAQDLLTDIIIRGGEERFVEDGLKFNKPPWWEPIYAVSFLSRFYFQNLGYTELLRQKYLTESEISLLNKKLLTLFEDYLGFCDQHDIDLVIILRPDKDEIINKQYNFDFEKILAYLNQNKNVKVIDLLDAYLKYMETTDTHVDRYFWKYDGHHNSRGYEMMARCIFEELNPMFN
ncbi:MAG: hypothetical protein WD048_11870 [Chitinophagales bacterium]